MTEIKAELVERMVAFVRDCAGSRMASAYLPTFQEANAIVAELPAPVDPDLASARELVAIAVRYGQSDSANGGRQWYEFRDGGCDDGDIIQGVLAAIKRGSNEF